MTKKLEDYPTVTPALQYEGTIMYVQDAPYYSATTLAQVIAERDAALARVKELEPMPMKYRRMEFNAQLQNEVKQLESDLAAARADGEKLLYALDDLLETCELHGMHDDKTYQSSKSICAATQASKE